MATKTKSVSGKDLPASDFLYVGDPEDTSTWSLPVPDADHVRNAMARFNQTQLPSDKKTAVARKLCAKAKSMGIDASGFEKDYCGTEHADFGNGWIEIFRAGDYGDKGRFDESDLDRIAAAYDPDRHEAPACIGHPEHDKPAYGWVDRLKRAGSTLLAKFKEVDPAFESAVKAGRFKKRSAAFYVGDDGRISALRHVAFLGAQPPEVKGLKNFNFDDAGRQFKSVDFEEESMAVDLTDKSLSEKIGEGIKAFFAERFGGPKAGATATFSEADVQRIATEAVTAATKPLQDQVATLKTELSTQTTKFSEREAQIATSETRQRAIDAVNRLKGKGNWVPAFEKMGLPLVFDELAKVTATVEFGEADKDGKKAKVTPLEILAQFLEGLPKIVPGGRTVNITAAQQPKAGSTGDPLTDLARARQKEKKISFSEALSEVAQEQPELTIPGGARAGAV